MKERITIEAPSKYGFQDTNKQYWSLKYGVDAGGIIPGNTYDIEYVASSTGKSKYITNYTLVGGSQATPVNTLPKTEAENIPAPGGEAPVKKAYTPRKSYTKPASDRDFDKEARGKTRCMAYQAALSSPAVANLLGSGSVDELKALVREIADDHFEYTFNDEKK